MPTHVLVTHSIGQTFSLQSLLLQGLLEGQDLSLVLFDCQFHCLARLRAALVCTQSVMNKISWQHRLKQRPESLCHTVFESVSVCHLFCFSLSNSLCRSLVRLSAWLFSSSRAPLQASHCRSFSSNSSFRDSSSTTCSSSMLHVVFSVSMFWKNKLIT